ncbi:MAG: PqiC family protein [Desulfobacterales bacterium]|nr:PqiC family protein [Desulfobacterales bacterium]MDD4072087.1 PqiC family protein [Desulfobacterales bacterium]MDD4394085.1 PqiC family protein [Desulfobacterales bacterium]
MPRVILCLITSACLLIPAGCFNIGSNTRPANTYFMLSPVTAPNPALQSGSAGQAGVIGVGPVELATYLNRPNIMIRINRNELRAADFARWAEPLTDNFSRTLAENISILAPENRIIMFPWNRTQRTDYQISVNVIRFDGTFGDNVTLISRWTLSEKNGENILLSRQSTFSEPLPDRNYAVMVSALSRTLESLSREIAVEIKSQMTDNK